MTGAFDEDEDEGDALFDDEESTRSTDPYSRKPSRGATIFRVPLSGKSPRFGGNAILRGH